MEKKSINKIDFISILFLKNKSKLQAKLSNNKIYKNTSSIKIIPEILKFRAWNINIVSILWKRKGEVITADPLKKYNISSKSSYLFLKNLCLLFQNDMLQQLERWIKVILEMQTKLVL